MNNKLGIDKAEVRRLLEEEGLSRKETADKLGCSTNNISMYIKKFGISYKRDPKHRFQANDKHPLWKGGKHLSGGYSWVFAPDHPRQYKKYVKEHILVMEQHLGRKLLFCEKVSHKDKNRLNNAIENLQLSSICGNTLDNATTEKCPRRFT